MMNELDSRFLAPFGDVLPCLHQHIVSNYHPSLLDDVWDDQVKELELYMNEYGNKKIAPANFHFAQDIILLSLLCLHTNYQFLSKNDFKKWINSRYYLKSFDFQPQSYAYIEFYIHHDNKMFFYIGKGTEKRVKQHTANGGQNLFHKQQRVKVFSIEVLAFLDFPKLPFFYENLFYNHFAYLCEELQSNFDFTFDLEFKGRHYSDYNYSDDMVDLFCANSAYLKSKLEKTASVLGEIHKQYFSYEFSKISNDIKKVLTENLKRI